MSIFTKTQVSPTMVLKSLAWNSRSLQRTAVFAAAAMSLAALPATVQAQVQRSVDNTSFEENDPPGTNAFFVYNNADVPGWLSESGQIEIWDSGHSSVPSIDGNQHAEMNAFVAGNLYQEVCLQNGELLTWRFYHRARNIGPSPQTVNYEIADLAGNQVQLLDTSTQTDTTQWFLSENNTGVPFTGASGLYRVQFATSDPGSLGNFIDGIELGITPFVQLKGATSQGREIVTSPDATRVLVSGQVTSPLNIQVQISGGTATLGTDYTTPSGSGTFNVTIPAGNYVNTEFDTGVAVIQDALADSGETIELRIVASPVNYVLSSTETCGATANTTSTHTIVEESDLAVTKTNTPGVNGEIDQTSDTVTSGSNTTYTLTVTNNGPDIATGALVTDVIGTGLTCPTTNTVTITGDGVPAGSFTVGDLTTGGGIVLDTLANGESAVLTYSCQVN